MQPTDQTGTNHPDQKYDGLIAEEKQTRRNALIRIGKYSAYAVPAVLALTAKAGPSSIPG
ncbi:hypothetical protein MCEGE14_01598 [Burkholderiaceae bacterium]